MVMIGGRLGWAFNNFLLYGQGGYATADVDTNAFFTATGAVEHTTSRRHDGTTSAAASSTPSRPTGSSASTTATSSSTRSSTRRCLQALL
jgi:opacity protein-like surface antigen